MSALVVPPLATSSVFIIRSSIAISASKQKVWDILLDFPSYGEWNPFMRTTELISEEDKKPPPSQIAAPGLRVRLRVNIPPTMDDIGKKATVTEEILTHVDSDTFRFAWHLATPARWLITAERWQVVRDDGPGVVVYEAWEFFGGLAGYLIRFFMAAKLQTAFDAMSHALKERAERAS
ncbi:hypothetical protein EDB92DRAFT_1946955 [Lactarius akahatsu]|uniref:Coenzyme Q-binding protein COQ10 START domain-containing protein n=1 Tax=Lactarius akahatsu TaxID=416441 RepID=A0AAD4QCV5_9AGAM|nr:hypothetical protein EDB92DRAFT_1946955 [Lactarius akahatsu]